MNAATPIPDIAGPRAVVVDINRELRWWRDHYVQYPLVNTTYSQAEATLKFAYDTYLLRPHEQLHALWPDIRRRYTQLPLNVQLEWSRAEQVIVQVWRRLMSS